MPDDREITVLCAKGDSSEYVAGPLSHSQRGRDLQYDHDDVCAGERVHTPAD